MAPIICEVHQILEDDSDKRVVRIRGTAFPAFRGKRCFRIKNILGGRSACFEAVYADDDYIDKWKKKTGKDLRDNDLVFMRKLWRLLLDVKPPEQGKPSDQVEVEEIQGNDSLYEVHGALSDDRNEGRIYIFNEELHDKITGKRHIARIKKRVDAKAVYSEVLYADDFYLKDWQEIWEKRGTVPNLCKLIFINEWYRLLLGTKIGEKIVLKEDDLLDPGKREGLWLLLYLYPRDHPQAVVRTASILGFIGLGLGVIGIGLGLSIIKDLFVINILAVIVVVGVFCVVGLAIALLGIIGLSIRR